MSRRYLSEKELEEEANAIFYESENDSIDSEPTSEPEDPYHDSEFSDEDYIPSECGSDSSLENRPDAKNIQTIDSDSEEIEDENDIQTDIPGSSREPQQQVQQNLGKNKQNIDTILWFNNNGTFVPRMVVPDKKIETTTLPRDISEFEIFLKLFPKSLMMYIAHCTNLRLEKFSKDTKSRRSPTDYNEIMITIGVSLIMSYNRVPGLNHYWSQHESLGNAAIKKGISRDRYKLLSSKMYFNIPEKPENAHKLYYIEEVINCFKNTFPKYRSEATFQSIDESMAKFKGRSSLKQFVPMKPIKRGIKLWLRSDSLTGYVYDLNVYAGKETEELEGTLGERVVNKLVSSIREPAVALCFDRFFSSVLLLDSLPYAAVGTLMSNRKNVPKFSGKLQRGDSEFRVNDNGTIVCRWQDTKELLAISNCFSDNVVMVQRTTKDGTKKEFSCPEMLQFYNNYMGGVDLTDQMAGLYDFNRKSSKWWKKVFYKALMMAVANAHVIYQDLHRAKSAFLPFLISVAEGLVALGRSKAGIKRKSASSLGRPTKAKKSKLFNVGDHLPIEGTTRRRCQRCSVQFKKEKRTTTLCRMCNIPLCKKCFTPYHVK